MSSPSDDEIDMLLESAAVVSSPTAEPRLGNSNDVDESPRRFLQGRLQMDAGIGGQRMLVTFGALLGHILHNNNNNRGSTTATTSEAGVSGIEVPREPMETDSTVSNENGNSTVLDEAGRTMDWMEQSTSVGSADQMETNDLENPDVYQRAPMEKPIEKDEVEGSMGLNGSNEDASGLDEAGQTMDWKEPSTSAGSASPMEINDLDNPDVYQRAPVEKPIEEDEAEGSNGSNLDSTGPESIEVDRSDKRKNIDLGGPDAKRPRLDDSSSTVSDDPSSPAMSSPSNDQTQDVVPAPEDADVKPVEVAEPSNSTSQTVSIDAPIRPTEAAADDNGRRLSEEVRSPPAKRGRFEYSGSSSRFKFDSPIVDEAEPDAVVVREEDGDETPENVDVAPAPIDTVLAEVEDSVSPPAKRGKFDVSSSTDDEPEGSSTGDSQDVSGDAPHVAADIVNDGASVVGDDGDARVAGDDGGDGEDDCGDEEDDGEDGRVVESGGFDGGDGEGADVSCVSSDSGSYEVNPPSPVSVVSSPRIQDDEDREDVFDEEDVDDLDDAVVAGDIDVGGYDDGFDDGFDDQYDAGDVRGEIVDDDDAQVPDRQAPIDDAVGDASNSSTSSHSGSYLVNPPSPAAASPPPPIPDDDDVPTPNYPTPSPPPPPSPSPPASPDGSSSSDDDSDDSNDDDDDPQVSVDLQPRHYSPFMIRRLPAILDQQEEDTCLPGRYLGGDAIFVGLMRVATQYNVANHGTGKRCAVMHPNVFQEADRLAGEDEDERQKRLLAGNRQRAPLLELDSDFAADFTVYGNEWTDLLIPMLINGNHWSVAVVRRSLVKATIYDSLDNPSSKAQSIAAIRKILEALGGLIVDDRSTGRFKVKFALKKSRDVQADGSSCGLFVIHHARRAIERTNANASTKPGDMPINVLQERRELKDEIAALRALFTLLEAQRTPLDHRMEAPLPCTPGKALLTLNYVKSKY